MKVWMPREEINAQNIRPLECYGIDKTKSPKGKRVWAVVHKDAVDYREYEYPKELWTLCLGPNKGDVSPLITPGDDRITIPGLHASLYLDQALTVILEHVRRL